MADEQEAALKEQLAEAGARLVSQKSLIRQLKADGAPGEQVAAEVNKMKEVQAEVDALQAQISGPVFDRDGFDDVILRRMIVVPSFEIHGGTSGFFDYGPVGCALKDNIVNEWKKHFVLRERMLQLEGTCLTSEPVLKTSGHVDRFVDLMVKDDATGVCYRADKMLEDHIENLISADPGMDKEKKEELELIYRQADAYSPDELHELISERFKIVAPDTGNPLSKPFPFNLMFQTTIGPEGHNRGFLRPETAQGIFVNFKRLLEYNNGRTPFASAQVGLGFRNEINPRNGLLRVREFCMAEIEHFVHPDEKDHPRFHEVEDVVLTLFPQDNQLTTGRLVEMTAGKAVADGVINNQTLAYFMVRTHLFMKKIGIDLKKLRFRQHLKTEMAHYACDCWDAEIKLSYGWTECVGHADRACYDLKVHSEATKVDLRASRPLDPPQNVEYAKVEANKKIMGKEFKRDSPAIIAYIGETLPVDEACAIGEKLAAGEKVDVEVDGKTFTLTSEMMKVSRATKTVHEERFFCSVIEPSFGIGRLVHSVLEHTFDMRGEELVKEKGKVDRTLFKFPPVVAPIKCAVLPLLRKEPQEKLAETITETLVDAGVYATCDTSGTLIGRKYARMDEIGVPFAITVDVQTLEDGSVTLRERDSQEQVRIPEVDRAVSTVTALCSSRLEWAKVVEEYGLLSSA
ncbi:Glycine--tRNA ligase [Hondaea fermentalgiana]|uniref:glycine--tRNA ligase n=1 Tax=Hondaea fermentalgiana TaxID=2315210 RepID=A0A2R5GNN7_9STRA|nr:Glycine--tRNA ligase [Hondaea fermentalgiana]|eukprot:GBG32507.1 Glycine--tRNA ligase [Hondaea fermentalgiana]